MYIYFKNHANFLNTNMKKYLISFATHDFFSFHFTLWINRCCFFFSGKRS